MSRAKSDSSALPLGAILVAMMTLTSCSSTPKISSAPIEVRDIVEEQSLEPSQHLDEWPNSVDEARPMEDRRRTMKIERAEYFERLATSQSPDSNSQNSALSAKLSSAEYFVQAGDFERAEQSIAYLDKSPLNTIQRDRFDIVSAYVLNAHGDYTGALKQLSQILKNNASPTQTSEPKPTTQYVDALLLSSFCYQHLGDYGSAIDALLKRESKLYGAARSETTRYTWQVINLISPERRELIIQSTSSPQVRNRIEQSLEGDVRDLATQPQQFNQWREELTQSTKTTIESDWSLESARNIAILLPLSSKFKKAAQALLDGIKYQDAENPSVYRPMIKVYDIGDNPFQAPQYYNAAVQAGADLIIGPLGKDYANQVSSYGSPVPTILLGGNTLLGANMTRLTISPELEGQVVAQKALRDGHLVAAILKSESSSDQRTVRAFTDKWLYAGGKISKVVSYSSQQYDHSTELKQLFDINQSEYRHKQLSRTLGFKPKFSAYQRSDIDFIFMLANNASGRILRPQINFFSGSKIPVYSTSAVYNGIQDKVNNIDLDQTLFPVMPWTLKSNEISHYAGQMNALFAMGTDAYRIAGNFAKLSNNPELALNGNTGQLSVGTNGEVTRQPVWASFEQGEAIPKQAFGIDLSPIQNHEQGADQEPNRKGVYNDSTWDTRQSSRKTGS